MGLMPYNTTNMAYTEQTNTTNMAFTEQNTTEQTNTEQTNTEQTNTEQTNTTTATQTLISENNILIENIITKLNNLLLRKIELLSNPDLSRPSRTITQDYYENRCSQTNLSGKNKGLTCSKKASTALGNGLFCTLHHKYWKNKYSSPLLPISEEDLPPYSS
jgi:hypothetical protein